MLIPSSTVDRVVVAGGVCVLLTALANFSLASVTPAAPATAGLSNGARKHAT